MVTKYSAAPTTALKLSECLGQKANLCVRDFWVRGVKLDLEFGVIESSKVVGKHCLTAS